MLEKELYQKMFQSSFSIPVKVTYWDGSEENYGNGEPVAKITFHEEIKIKDILRNASLTLGEAYMSGKIDIDGSIEEVINSAYENADSFLRSSKFRQWMPKLDKHTVKKSKTNVKDHYDIGNDFYELWLDPTLSYSCAYFKSPDDTLEQAQYNKIHHILDKCVIQKGDTLLDIGCGWGTLMFEAVEKYGAKATGITLSEEQFEHVQAEIKKRQIEDSCEVLLMDYRELKDRTFQHIVSVGMFEHVGPENLGAYFAKVQELLADKGTALIHGISRQQGGATNAWINQYIFPGGYVPGVAELVNHITENDLQLIDLESLRRHYQKTLECWTDNFHAVEEQVLVMEGKEFYRMWDLYLQACAASFKSSNIDVIQYLLTNPGNNTLPLCRQV